MLTRASPEDAFSIFTKLKLDQQIFEHVANEDSKTLYRTFTDGDVVRAMSATKKKLGQLTGL